MSALLQKLRRLTGKLSRSGPTISRPFVFGVVGINHPHIYHQVKVLREAGGTLQSFFAREDDLAARFQKKYPHASRARAEAEVLEDESISVIASAAIPADRAAIGLRAMRHGKDVLMDKPGATTLDQVTELRRAHQQTGRFYTVLFSERLLTKSTVRALELTRSGAIGRVLHTLGTGPHRPALATRPDWFFNKERYGGILVDLAAHQIDQFLTFTNSTEARIVAAQVGNLNHPEYPELEDFGDLTLHGNGGLGYIRVDWFTPAGLPVWGDSRLFILGTEGTIEVRKYVDVGGRPGADHLFIVDAESARYEDCSRVDLPFPREYGVDLAQRTQNAISQEHVFRAMELAIRAELQATVVTPPQSGRALEKR